MKRVGLLFLIGLLFYIAEATAATVQIDDVTGSFLNATPPGAATIVNGPTLSTIRWGTDLGSGQSGYDFNAVVPPAVSTTVPPSPSPWMQLGEFTHLNRPVTGTLIDGVDLNVDLAMHIDATAVNVTFGYHLTHTETPNSPPCPSWQISGIACDDRVDISSPASGVFLVGGVLYTLQLGFSTDSGATILDHFITTEGLDNQAGFYGQFTSDTGTIVPVPEPATMLLLGSGLIGLAGYGRKKLFKK